MSNFIIEKIIDCVLKESKEGLEDFNREKLIENINQILKDNDYSIIGIGDPE